VDISCKYRETLKIRDNIIRIEVAKKIIDLLPKLPHIEESFRHKSLLKSSLFSARIEGNRLEIEEIENIQNNTSRSREKKEVFNILQALKWIHSIPSKKIITVKTILKLHKFVMNGLSADVGHFRNEPSAIFTTGGIAIYMTPPPSELPTLINNLLATIKTGKDHVVIKSAIAHFAFEKIHPFLDGNGRVGRLLSAYILKSLGYGFRGLVVIEEYISNHREEYYDLLAVAKKDITDFVEFFLRAVLESTEKAIEELQNTKEEKATDSLLPRRQEIIAIIKDHKMVSFDFIRRRFYKIPDSSLHYDIRMLIKKGFIKKLGDTRGALYELKDR
jgi:Fic family protein